MATRRLDRLQRVARGVATAPLNDQIVNEAFDRFRANGSLPNEDRVAQAVLDRALARRPDKRQEDLRTILRFLYKVDAKTAADETPVRFDLVRRRLFGEAMHTDEFVRVIARLTLVILVEAGVAVTDPIAFDLDPDGCATVGAQILGYPQTFFLQEDANRGQELMARFDELRERVHPDDAWFANLAEAAGKFRDAGTLPTDEDLRDAVLANAQLLDLLRGVAEAGPNGGVLQRILAHIAGRVGAG